MLTDKNISESEEGIREALNKFSNDIVIETLEKLTKMYAQISNDDFSRKFLKELHEEIIKRMKNLPMDL